MSRLITGGEHLSNKCSRSGWRISVQILLMYARFQRSINKLINTMCINIVPTVGPEYKFKREGIEATSICCKLESYTATLRFLILYIFIPCLKYTRSFFFLSFFFIAWITFLAFGEKKVIPKLQQVVQWIPVTIIRGVAGTSHPPVFLLRHWNISPASPPW